MENNICKLAFGVWLPNPNVKDELTHSGSEMYKILYNLYIKTCHICFRENEPYIGA